MLFVCGFVGQGAGGETSGSDTGGGETALGAGERLKLGQREELLGTGSAIE